jgi:SAM-dependent methyltransferase
LATAKAEEARLPARFVCADVGHLPPDLAAAEFDVVYTAIGVLVWIPDVQRWANVVATALRPGGRFVLLDEHPIAMGMWGEDGHVRVVDDYFGRHTPTTGTGWSHFPGGEDATEATHNFSWPLGDILNALIDAGLVIGRVDEFPTRSKWRFADALDEARGIPGELLIIARKAG